MLDGNSVGRSRVAPPLSGRFPYCGKAKGPLGGSARAHSALTPRPRRPVLGASCPSCCAQQKALHLAALHALGGLPPIRRHPDAYRPYPDCSAPVPTSAADLWHADSPQLKPQPGPFRAAPATSLRRAEPSSGPFLRHLARSFHPFSSPYFSEHTDLLGRGGRPIPRADAPALCQGAGRERAHLQPWEGTGGAR